VYERDARPQFLPALGAAALGQLDAHPLFPTGRRERSGPPDLPPSRVESAESRVRQTDERCTREYQLLW
jgi:hypothetical protein